MRPAGDKPMPIAPGLIESVTGAPALHVAELVNYGYRAAWHVWTRTGEFLVKADERAGWIAHEVSAVRHSEAHGIPVAGVAGVAVGALPAAAFRWVPGTSLTKVESSAAWRAAGEVLRAIHSTRVPGPRQTQDFVAFEKEIAWLVDHALLHRGEGAAMVAAMGRSRHLLSNGQVTWTHGDCQAEHFIVDEDTGRIAAVIDWADAAPGAPEADFAVLTLFDPGALPAVLEGYGATPEFRERLATVLPLYQALRAAVSLHWLEVHGYRGHTWPLEKLRALLA